MCTNEDADLVSDVQSNDEHDLHLVCKETRVGISINGVEDMGDVASPNCSLPPAHSLAGLHSNWV